MDTDNEIEKLKKSCRLCLCSDQDVSIYAEHKDGLKFIDITLFLVNIDTKDETFPDSICMECASKLILFYKFKQKCETSNCTLTALFCSNTADNFSGLSASILTKGSDEPLINEQDACILNDNTPLQNESNNQELDNINKKVPNKNTISENNTELNLLQKDSEIDLKTIKTDTIECIPTIVSDIPNKVVNLPEKLCRCEFCKETFDQKQQLLQHNLLHCVLKKFSCKLCGNRFTRKSHLVIHMRRHTNEKPYICEFCSRRFIKSGDLSRHRRIHKNEKNYFCNVCDKRFKRSSDVTCHMRTHTGERPYHCKECTKSYTSHSSLKKHLRHHVK